MPGEELVDDLFGAAFDEEIGAAPPKELEEKPEPETTAEPAEPEVKPEPEAKVEPEAQPEPTAPVVAPLTTEDVAKVVKDALAAKEEPAKETPAEPEPEDPKVLEALKELEEQWPTHKVAVNALVEKALKKQREEMLAEFKAIVTPLQEQLAPVVQTVQTDAAARHMATITAAHPDALTILPEVEAWIAKQPAYLQPAFNAVLDGGSAAEVIGFYDDYKKATGKVAAPAAAPAVDEERLKRMETPATVRTSVTAEAEPDDFDSAFESELKKFKAA